MMPAVVAAILGAALVAAAAEGRVRCAYCHDRFIRKQRGW